MPLSLSAAVNRPAFSISRSSLPQAIQTSRSALSVAFGSVRAAASAVDGSKIAALKQQFPELFVDYKGSTQQASK